MEIGPSLQYRFTRIEFIFSCKERMDPQDVLKLYRLFLSVSDNTRFLVNTKDHVCSATTCSLLNIGDLFLCLESGRVHYCDADNGCKYMREHHQGLTCPVSGYVNRQPVLRDDVGDLIARCAWARKQQRKEDRAAFEKQEKLDAKPRQNVLKAIRILCDAKKRHELEEKRHNTAKRRVVYRMRQYKAQQEKTKRPIQWIFAFNVLQSEQKSPVESDDADAEDYDEDDFELLADTVLYWWHQLKSRIEQRNRPYRIEYHTVAVLYTLRDGIRDAGNVIFEPNRLVRKYLPRLSDVGDFGYTKRSVTHHIQKFNHAYLNWLRCRQ